MGAGRTWPAECSADDDALSGVRVLQLTSYKGHSHHLYFTNPGWWDGGRRLLFGSDRDNRTNLFSIELKGGAITQLTDLEPTPPPNEVQLQTACVNPTRAEAYLWHGRDLLALDLHSLQTRTIFSRPRGFLGSMLNCTADGRYLCTSYFEDLSRRFGIAYHQGYVGFAETFQAHPLSRIIRVATAGAGAETIREEQTWIGHVNTSPTQPNLLTYCHEGPWNLVDNRIWGMDIDKGDVWPIRSRRGGETVGHEYWHADGIHVGYHGSWPDGRRFFGMARYNDIGGREVDFPHETGHIHSNDFSMIVGDGGRVVRLWRWDGERFEGPRALCEHRSSMHVQEVHVHPRFTPDGKQVLFTSDRTGYGNVYLARIEEFDTLPAVE
jgi:oligogalacturonide lyase